MAALVAVSVLVLNSVSTAASKIVVALPIDVVIVVIVAVGTIHSIVPVCCLTSSLTSAKPPSIDALEQLWTLSPAHSLHANQWAVGHGVIIVLHTIK